MTEFFYAAALISTVIFCVLWVSCVVAHMIDCEKENTIFDAALLSAIMIMVFLGLSVLLKG